MCNKVFFRTLSYPSKYFPSVCQSNVNNARDLISFLKYSQKLQYIQEFTINTLLQKSVLVLLSQCASFQGRFIVQDVVFAIFLTLFPLLPASVSANYFFAKQWQHFSSCELSKYWMCRLLAVYNISVSLVCQS